MPDFYSEDNISGLEAISAAQRLAFAPMLFQCARCLRDFGVLKYLDGKGKAGATLTELAEHVSLSEYALGVLLDMGLSGRLVHLKEEHYILSKIGYFLLHDPMTCVNFNFTQDVCYEALNALPESLQQGRPAGLKALGYDLPTIYPVLSKLPGKAKDSWFAFDHFYSDAAFKQALPFVFASKPARLFDLGGNTGRFTQQCLQYDSQVQVNLLDLPEQTALVARSEWAQPYLAQDRLKLRPVNVLTDTALPEGADVWWLSQFLDCFAPEEVVAVLQKIRATLTEYSRVFVLELCFDAQRFEAASFSLNATNLYFTCLANGNSRFYSKKTLLQLVEQAGLRVVTCRDGIGLGHTLLELAL